MSDYDTVVAMYYASVRELLAASLERVRQRALEEFPKATTLELSGYFNEDGLLRINITGIHGTNPSPDRLEGLERSLEDPLYFLGELSGEEYWGDHEIELQPTEVRR